MTSSHTSLDVLSSIKVAKTFQIALSYLVSLLQDASNVGALTKFPQCFYAFSTIALATKNMNGRGKKSLTTC